MTDEQLIRRTLTLAVRARGKTSPNPMVGALLVKNGKVIAEGFHRKAGTAHAEVVAIEQAGERARGATLYVSLEPCCHKDKRTPPCTQKIITSGIRKVVVAMADPNARVSGKGIEELERAGIPVTAGILAAEARRLNEYYVKHITTGLPFVVMKVAMTLDGKIATPEGESKWITGEESRKMVHRLRGSVDAIMTAIGTVRADNPSLTCRTRGGCSPLRVIVDPRLETDHDAVVLKRPPETILVAASGAAAGPRFAARRRSLEALGIRILTSPGGRVDLRWLLKELGGMGVTSLLAEGGSSLNAECLEAGIVDRAMFFIAPIIMGGRESVPAVGGRTFRPLAEAHRLKERRVRTVGQDILIEGLLA